MVHLCKYNLEFIGLGYDFYEPKQANYGAVTFKLFQCKKCKRLFYKDKVFIADVFESIFDSKLLKLRDAGYKSIGNLISK